MPARYAASNADAAQSLCQQVQADSPYQVQVALAQANGIAAAQVHEMASRTCSFFAMSFDDKVAHWSGLLEAAVASGRLTDHDREVLDGMLFDPAGTMAEWQPETNFGLAMAAAYDNAVGGTNNDDDTESLASTAGDVGTIFGAIIGGLGGTPMSVGIGAAVGKLMGEAANAAGEAMYEWAPETEPDDGGGPADGGDEVDDGGEEGEDGGGGD